MSRSALWRQEDNVKERERKAALTFGNAVEEGRNNNHLKGVIPLACPDDTFNLHPMLLHNVVNSAYFQKCCEKLTDWNTLVDEIYYEVKHMEPWTAGELQSLYRIHVGGEISV
jgi:pre-mRNA-splicing factor 38B